MKDLFGEKAEMMSKVYDVVNIVDNTDIFNSIFNYYVDVKTKEVRIKEVTNIQKLEG